MTTEECITVLSSLFSSQTYQGRNQWTFHIDSLPARTLILSDSFVQMTLKHVQPQEFLWLVQGLPDTQWQRLPDGSFMTILS